MFLICIEDGITVSSTRTLQFYVKHEPGALAEALKAFCVSSDFVAPIIIIGRSNYGSVHVDNVCDDVISYCRRLILIFLAQILLT